MMVMLIGAVPALSQGDAPVRAIAEILLAKDDGAGAPGDFVEGFLTTDIPIYCVVMLSTSEPTLVKMNFVAVQVAGVKPGTHVVSSQYTTRAGENRVDFSGRPHGQWVAGTYRVDVKAGSEPVQSLTFQITKPNRP